MQSRKQRLAKAVWEKVPEKSASDADVYGKWAHKLPVLIRSAGLAHALAFADSKAAKEAEKKMLKDFCVVVSENPQTTTELFGTDVRNAPLQEYMRLTRRSLEVCVWFKRFAESKLGVKADTEDRE